MPQVGFKPPILASEGAQTHALECTATGIGYHLINIFNYSAD
jgi:hypothetical protein